MVDLCEMTFFKRCSGKSGSFVVARRGGWTGMGVSSSGAVVLCLGGDGGGRPPKTLGNSPLYSISSSVNTIK